MHTKFGGAGILVFCTNFVYWPSFLLFPPQPKMDNQLMPQCSLFRGSYPSCILLRITARSMFPVMLPRSVWKLLRYLNSVSFLIKKWQHSIHRRKHEIKTNTCDLGYIITKKGKNTPMLISFSIEVFLIGYCSRCNKKSLQFTDVCIFLSCFPTKNTSIEQLYRPTYEYNVASTCCWMLE